jgi:transposase
MRKQCLKRQDIHRALIEKGFSISYSSVCKYIQRRKAEKAKKPKDVFVKQYYEPGDECEFDWGEVKLRIDGKPVTFTMAVFALCHSEGRWAYLFRHQDNLAFMESHRNFFHDVHGVPHTMVYDNMKVAVILKPDGKKPTETLLRMEAFYGFGHRFCNARAGWEKGHVERSVDYVRGRAFTTRVDFASIEDAQMWLGRICDELGYVGFDKEGAEMLFNHLSLRTGKKATIITTNLPFTRWEEVLKDKVLCSALVDRLCHKSYLVNMTGTSYRIKETKKLNDNKQ